MDIEDVKRIVSIDIQKDGKTSESYPKRLHNIKWIEDALDRSGLRYQQKEKQLLIKVFDSGKELFIQYPGKESIRTTKPNMLDFRPVLYDPRSNKYHKDLSFPDIWGALDKLIDDVGPGCEKELALFATLLYRIAFMSDHFMSDKEKTKERLIDITKNRIEGEANIDVPPRYCYKPRQEVIAEVTSVLPSVAGMSMDEFLCYIDVLSWNEDCKYYERKKIKAKKNDWYKIGRINTIKTVIVFIGAKIGFIPILKVFNEFGRQGIAKPDDEDIIVLGGGYISPGPKTKRSPK